MGPLGAGAPVCAGAVCAGAVNLAEDGAEVAARDVGTMLGAIGIPVVGRVKFLVEGSVLVKPDEAPVPAEWRTVVEKVVGKGVGVALPTVVEETAELG